jgi:hypothetical protein
MKPRQSRSVAFVYGGVAGVLLVVVATVALVVAPPSPPSVAEFAPSAEETIDKAPDSQSSQFGAGAGGACAAGQVCEGPQATTTTTAALARPGTTTPPVVVKARVRRCVGDPPRQTEDPQSPPCVNYFEGDNGGATTKGVTRDEIRIGISSFYRPSGNDSVYQALVDHFNRRYEFYGRRLTSSFLSADGTPEEQRAAAQEADEQLDLFAMAGNPGPTGGDLRPFHDEIARRGLISIDEFGTNRDEGQLAARRPNLWTYAPTLDKSLHATASWACTALVGRTARYAGPPLNLSQRAFGILRPFIPNGRPNVDGLKRDLERCGARDIRVYDLPEREGPNETDPAYRRAIASMQADGRTSLICVCTSGPFEQLFPAAANSQYEPEWITAGLFGAGADDAGGLQNAGALRIFGLSPAAKPLPIADSPWAQAVRESNPDVAIGPSDDTGPYAALYHALLVLASGIQGAGPRLTPVAFENGLLKTTFSNPGAATAPFYQGHVGFGAGDHSMVDDFAVVFKDANANPNAARPGGYCYVRRGERWTTTFPDTEAELFDKTKPCR